MKDFEIFEGKTYDGLMEDIYDNHKEKKQQINLLIKELQPLIKDVSDATMIVPLIKDYLDIGVKNDEHLVKLAQVVQRLLNSSNSGVGADGEGGFLPEEERKQLLDEAKTEVEQMQKENEKLLSKKEKAKRTKNKLEDTE